MSGEMAEQDIDDAITYGDLDDDIYCECPVIHDMEETDTGVCSCCGKLVE